MSTSRSLHRFRRPALAAVAVGASLTLAPVGLAGGETPPPKPDCVTYPSKCALDVSIAKTSDAETYAPGDVVTYTLTVTNTGGAAVARERIVVSDPSLADLAPLGATTGWLQPGQSTSWVGTRTLTAAECGTLVNTATVALTPKKNGGTDTVPGNDTATRTVVVGGGACVVTPPPAAVVPAAMSPAVVAPPVTSAGKPVCPRPTLAAVVRGPANPKGGTTARYHVTIRTTGVTASKVTLRLALPAGFSLPGTGNVARLRGGDLVVGIGTLRRGSPHTVPVALRLDRSARGARTIKASITAKCGATAAAARTLQAVAVAPLAVQPAVTG